METPVDLYAKQKNVHANTVRRWIKNGRILARKDSSGKVFVITEEENEYSRKREEKKAILREKIERLDRKEIREMMKQELVVDFMASGDSKERSTMADKIIKMYGFEKDALAERMESLLKEVYDMVMKNIEKTKGKVKKLKPKKKKPKKKKKGVKNGDSSSI